jgi:hypothetical protein
VRERIFRVLDDRPFEERLRVPERLARPDIEEVASAQVELIRLGIDGVPLAQPLGLVTAHANAQRVRQLFDDLRLQHDDVRVTAIQGRSPQLGTVLDVDELGAHGERTGTLRDAADQHCLHTQLPADRLRIRILTFEAKDGAARHHAQPRDL